MEQVKNTIGVDSYGSADGGRVGLETTSRMDQLSNWRRRHGLVVAVGRSPACPATNSLGNINAGLCGVAGLARVDDIFSSDIGRAARVASQSLRIRARGAVAMMMSTRFRRSSIAFFGRSVSG